MENVQIPSKNSAFRPYKQSRTVGTMVIEVKNFSEGEDKTVLLSSDVKALSEETNRSSTVSFMVGEDVKGSSEEEDNRALERSTQKLESSYMKGSSEGSIMVDNAMELSGEKDKRVLKGNAQKPESSYAKGLSKGIRFRYCEKIKSGRGSSTAEFQNDFKLPSWRGANIRTKLVVTKGFGFESKKRDYSGCVLIDGGEYGKETVEKTRHLDNEMNKNLATENTGSDGNYTATKAALNSGRLMENEINKKQELEEAGDENISNAATKAALSTEYPLYLRFSYGNLASETSKKQVIENAIGDSNYIPNKAALSTGTPSSSSALSARLSCPIPSRTILRNTGIAPMLKTFLFEKILSQSDVNDLNRLLLPIKHAETYFPRLEISEGKHKKETLLFFDQHNITWEMKFEVWESRKSYVLTRGWMAFVNHYQLQRNFVVRFYQLDQIMDKKHYSIDYVIPETNKKIRLFGQDYHYSCIDANNCCGGRGNGGGGESSTSQNVTVKGNTGGAAMKEGTGH